MRCAPFDAKGSALGGNRLRSLGEKGLGDSGRGGEEKHGAREKTFRDQQERILQCPELLHANAPFHATHKPCGHLADQG